MNDKQLLYFVTIIEEGNITKAAQKLHISQPPLSMQLKMLEDELGCELIERGNRKCVVTDEGRLLYQYSKNIIALSQNAITALNDLKHGVSGTLRLGTVSSSGTALLTEYMARFRRDHPGIRVELHEGNTYQLLDLLEKNIIDVAVVRTPFATENLECIYLKSEPMVAVGVAEYWKPKLSNKSTIKITQLKQKPLILCRRFELLILSSFQDKGISPQIFCQCDDARTALQWARAGLGVSLMSETVALILGVGDMELKYLDEPKLTTRLAIIRRKKSSVSAISRYFLSYFE